MRILYTAPALALALAACGGGSGGKAALVESCVADGESTEMCECMADTAEAELDGPTFDKLVTAAKGGDDATEQMMNDLSPEEQGKFMAFAMKAAMTCGAGQ